MKKDEGVKVEAGEGVTKDKKDHVDLKKKGSHQFSKSSN